VNVDHNHLTKEESEIILQKSIHNCLVKSHEQSKSFKTYKQEEKYESCMASFRIHKEKSEKLILSKGDDFPFLNEEEN